MRQRINVLIVEDHQLMVEAYARVLTGVSDTYPKFQFDISVTHCCASSVEKLNQYSENTHFDLIILDIRVPAAEDKKYLSGEDIGVLARKIMPNVKILVITSISDNFRLNNILKNVVPDGLLLKTDISSMDLRRTIRSLLRGIPFYSDSVLKLLRKRMSTELNLDIIDRQLLHQISMGVKMKNLPKFVPLSMGGIESRKRRLKKVFAIDDEEDATLIKTARDKGFI